jgi:trk system potassium uptake protein TrkH
MHVKTILRILGLLLILYSISMTTPLLVNLIYQDGVYLPFIESFVITLLTGLIFYFPTKHSRQELKIRDGFVVVVLFWVVICLFSAIPLYLAPNPHLSLTNAIFESVSGITTTGATILKNIDTLPHNILYYRQQMQFLGGMGIVVLAVAIMPMLGIGGMQLYRTETPGPLKENKLTPRIAQSAKALWLVYVILTALCALSYKLCGMSLFDAICGSFATIATGGFSVHSESFAYYQSNAIEMVGCFFMFLGGVNFTLHFLVFKKRSLKPYFQDEEFINYAKIIVLATATIATILVTDHLFDEGGDALIKAIFNVISLMTTTGLTTASFSDWPKFIPILLMMMAVIGGCAASTTGGIKVLRMLLIMKQSDRELMRLIHPNAIVNIKFGGKVLSRSILQSMWSFISIFLFFYLLLVLLYMAFGNDLTTSVGITTATLANAGAGIGDISQGFSGMNEPTKWVSMIAMLAGRLEIFSLLILFSPHFWND